MKVLLVCSAGMSTSILMKKLDKYASERGIDFEIAAVGVGTFKDICANYDCILMGPQISYQKDKVVAGAGGVPVAVIPPTDYGIGNCEHIFELINELLANK